ncbi:short-chain dehydrogenase [Chryseobacterium contaminans]|uniref:NAD(P)-dependent dehydrogenase, short-chain alcohol dehydrogenase family n=1 Tax=Chryseobacterium contaminans TaxID=1423959 RepID=A0A1M6ZIN0_9FLAO|nr:SDR family oxidoreductase [Chryseobacterium contaminans]OCA69218.1 short-chain dehydrogenase [Chryseobacterium contaminans]SHL30317.1 NAD(P)-dependent dehydrogenase, short-chain alcohol dehydrogenase family [Chryseobacterium contaminans]
MEDLKGKIAVITGGNSGIGYATAQRLKENGAEVIITGRRKEALEKAAEELNVTAIVADQSKLSDIENLVQQVRKQFGKIDILLINAGITKFATIEETSENLFDEIMNVNFKGAYFTLSRFIPLLNDGASVIMLSSTSATISPQSASIYAASKAAINAVVKIAALELASRKIRINAVSPGPIATEIMDKIGLTEDLENHLIQSIPLKRMGKAKEVAEMIYFLTSENASFLTGANFLVDGGQSI